MSSPLPQQRPQRPNFSSGPCAKRPGWSETALGDALLGRSHRSAEGKARLQAVIDESRALLEMPDDYRLAIVPASDTGAVEMALWSLLGPRGVDVFAWESFGRGWLKDIREQLQLSDLRALVADYGELPDLSAYDGQRDCIFTWNGTTSGVRVKDASFIADDREALTICDATSAAFAMELDWPKLDVVTWSWQKVLGGEAAHGMLALSPRAVERLEQHTPRWPLPKIFRMTNQGKLNEALFRGATINTPSMLAVEDALDSLRWARDLGGLTALCQRSQNNLAAVAAWVEHSPWVEFLAPDPATRSSTAICLAIVDPRFRALDGPAQRAFTKAMCQRLESEGVALDINGYKDAPPGLRLWGGATVESEDLARLGPWLDWAFAETVAQVKTEAPAD